MADKQALNATFFAFRKRDKAVLLPATIAYAVVGVGAAVLFFLLNAQAFGDYFNWWLGVVGNAAKSPDVPPSPETMMPPQSIAALIPALLLFQLVSYILLAAYEAACLRGMIHGESGGLFGLTLGADTWRVYFTYWIWLLLLILFYIVCAITVGGAVFSIALGMQSGGQPSASAVIVPLVLGLVVLIALVYFSVRFAPAAATSIARRRFAFFDAWKVTKGRFWALFGSFLLLWVMFVVFIIALEVVLVLAMAGAAVSAGGHGEAQSAEAAFRAFANPAWAGAVVAFIAVCIVASFLFYIALFGVNARAAALALEEGKITAAS